MHQVKAPSTVYHDYWYAFRSSVSGTEYFQNDGTWSMKSFNNSTKHSYFKDKNELISRLEEKIEKVKAYSDHKDVIMVWRYNEAPDEYKQCENAAWVLFSNKKDDVIEWANGNSSFGIGGFKSVPYNGGTLIFGLN